MPTTGSITGKGVFICTVLSNKQFGEHFYKLRLEFTGAGAEAFAKFRPGQFVQIDLSGVALPPLEKTTKHLLDVARRSVLLRRPFSLADVTSLPNKTTAELIYCVIGPATLRMTTLSSGNILSVIGPLGNGFWIPKGKKTALLAAGGIGIPPLQHLAKVLSAEHSDIEAVAFVGAKTARELPFEGRLDALSQQLGFAIPELAKFGMNSMIATDDGSAGYHGLVTDCLTKWITQQPQFNGATAVIYGCGPPAMLAEVARIAQKRQIDCQVCMEEMMACGIGLCQSCAVECRVPGSNETIYKLCCDDGPVFDSREVVFRE